MGFASRGISRSTEVSGLWRVLALFGGAVLPPLFFANSLVATTLTVAGVVVDGIDGSRVGGAKVGLSMQASMDAGSWAFDRTSQSGVYSLVLNNLVGDAPLRVYVTYYGAGTNKVADPIALLVDPSTNELIREKPGDLVLLSTEKESYTSAETETMLSAIARSSEFLSWSDPSAREQREYLRAAALEVRENSVAVDEEIEDRFDRLMGRVALASVMSPTDEGLELDFLENYGLAGAVVFAQGSADQFSPDSWEVVKSGASLHQKWPQLNIQIRAAGEERAALLGAESLQKALVSCGADPRRIGVSVTDTNLVVVPEIGFDFEIREHDG